MQDVDAHAARIARDGYTILEDAIEPELVDALAADLLRLERELDVRPARNAFEGTHTVRIYNLLVHGHALRADPGAPERAAGRRARARRRLPGLVAVVDRHRPGRDARSRSTPTTS